MNDELRMRFSELIDLIYTHTEPTVRQVLANRVDVLFNGVSREIERCSELFYKEGYGNGFGEGNKYGRGEAYDSGELIGYEEGYEDGRRDGYEDGYEDGKFLG